MPPAASEQPQSLPVPRKALWSGRHSYLCNHLSAEAQAGPRGPSPSLRGFSELVRGAETCRTAPLCSGRAAGAPLGHLLSRDTMLQLPGAMDVCQ